MGQEPVKSGPAPPVKTLKGKQLPISETVKEYTKEINGMRREYQREKMKLEYQGKALQKDLKKKIEKKEPVVGVDLCSNTKRWRGNRSSRTTRWWPSTTN